MSPPGRNEQVHKTPQWVKVSGALAVVLIAVAGSVVDFTYMQTARTRAQTAIDSAALALQTRIGIDNVSTLTTKAQSLITERLGDSAADVRIARLEKRCELGMVRDKECLGPRSHARQIIECNHAQQLCRMRSIHSVQVIDVPHAPRQRRLSQNPSAPEAAESECFRQAAGYNKLLAKVN